MRRVIGIDVHRTFGEVAIWEDGVLRHAGRVDMTRTALEGLGKKLRSTDEVVIEATGNSMAVSRVLNPRVRQSGLGAALATIVGNDAGRELPGNRSARRLVGRLRADLEVRP